MRRTEDWRRIRVAGVDVEVPPDLEPSEAAAGDQPAATLEGAGLRLILDRGPFADPLTGYASQPEHSRRRETIGDQPADVVSFRAHDGTEVVAARLPGELTAVVHAEPGVDPEIAMRVLRSIRPTSREE